MLAGRGAGGAPARARRLAASFDEGDDTLSGSPRATRRDRRASARGAAARRRWHARGVGRRISDERLTALSGLTCRRCGRPGARGTGVMTAPDDDPNAWLIEVECDGCGAASFVWAPEVEAVLRRIAREHAEARGRATSATVSGEIGGDAPAPRPGPAAPPEPALLRVRETVSELACTTGRAFWLTVHADGRIVHDELQPGGPVRAPPLRRDVEGRDRLPSLRRLFARAGFAGLPATLGDGEQALEVAWSGDGDPTTRTLRCRQGGAARDFAGAAVPAGAALLVDGLWQLARWVDGGGLDPPWPIAPVVRLFPRAEDLLAGARAVRLTATHDRDGPTRNLRARELWVAESGAVERRTVRQGPWPTLDEIRGEQLSAGEARALFERLAALRPAEFRRRVGHVRSGRELDETHTRTLDWFDGARVHRTALVLGRERGLGVSHGDAPPRADEAAAFELLAELARRG
jgi:hypothetical protein